MKRIPDDFCYPVVYPNGIVIYCDSFEEQIEYQKRIEEMKQWLTKLFEEVDD